ncbi:MAG: hypothetical protein COB93_00795 [Sneathiella sp.]|nr:MAG: hypothetical protein COB93_00795 [Sneathiella sp.]
MKALLDKKKKEQAASQPADKDTKKSNSAEKVPNTSTKAMDRSLPMTLSEEDALRQQVQKCWIVPIGAADAGDLVVSIRMRFNQDGTLNGYPEIIMDGGFKSEFHRVAAESAKRAVLKCAPYKLPLEKYESWREVKMNFDPKDMFR